MTFFGFDESFSQFTQKLIFFKKMTMKNLKIKEHKLYENRKF